MQSPEPRKKPQARPWSDSEKLRLVELRTVEKDVPWAVFQKKYFPDRSLAAIQGAYSPAEGNQGPTPSKGRKRSVASSGTPESFAEPKKTKTICGFDSDNSEDEPSNQLFVEENTFVKAQAAERCDTRKAPKTVTVDVAKIDKSSCNITELPEGMQFFEKIINEYKSLQQTLVQMESKLKESEDELKSLKMSTMTDKCQFEVAKADLQEEMDLLKAELLQVKSEKVEMKPATSNEGCQRCTELEEQLDHLFTTFRPAPK
ncbi:uncharacterized protein BO95DRAFT_482566 [Aspergillus brunneoviolaceus CBS 621.78]|uniref:Uncharacterized protein n=1 Tax=Aspergillus brunneoviolaceus CBS 621.78 TaxID=1450534 RepID=A0ACD1G7E5_9EURO|nr:hypothetical protein BO95DRAFT_482566 [Aspergillus brunneoviolaceus CBS 621.78]RAH45137.1 hypothetical protein BO95DRAFT_482566 [Aspergillus brunneoviolaceus CBS 621.78]